MLIVKTGEELKKIKDSNKKTYRAESSPRTIVPNIAEITGTDKTNAERISLSQTRLNYGEKIEVMIQRGFNMKCTNCVSET